MRKLDSTGDRIFLAFIYLLAILFMLVILLPVLYVFVSSFTLEQEILRRGFFVIPEKLTLASYHYLFENSQFMRSLFVSIVIMVGGTAISMLLTILFGYGLSKRWLIGRRFFGFMVICTMMFNGGIIPLYMVVKEAGMLNTLWSLMIPNAILPFYLIVLRTFFQNIPEEIEESASMDGCSESRLLLQIVMPLSVPVIATFTLFYAVHNWNSFFHAIMFITKIEEWPMAVYLRQMLVVGANDMKDTSNIGFVYGNSVKNAAIVIFTAPILLFYPIVQKYFKEGMMLGSVKG